MILIRRRIFIISSVLVFIILTARIYRLFIPSYLQCTNEFHIHHLDDDDDDDSHVVRYEARLLEEEDIPAVRVKNISCLALFKGDEYERRLSTYINSTTPYKSRTALDIIQETQDCEQFVEQRRYARGATSLEEQEFPIAYSILVYRDVEQFERLLRSIYRPQNIYCLHVDSKSASELREAVSSISRCLPSTFLTPRSLDVEWGRMSVLEVELMCMEELWKRWSERKWKYFINLTGQEFPLKTNEEIVRILKAFNGSNNMEGTVLRIPAEFVDELQDAACGVRITKGSVHIIASWKFVDFILHSPTANLFLEWVKTKYSIPDEIFFSSLNHSPHLHVPGAYTGIPETDSTHYRFIPRYKNWGEPPFSWPCPGGLWVRQICLLSVGDLPLLSHRPELFANKFLAGFDPHALDCMEELHYNRTRLDIRQRKRRELKLQQPLSGGGQQQQQPPERLRVSQSDLESLWKRLLGTLQVDRSDNETTRLLGRSLDISFYSNLDFVKNHV